MGRVEVCYRYGKDAEEMERMDYLEFTARVTSHIPDNGQGTIRYFGLYANAHRGRSERQALGLFLSGWWRSSGPSPLTCCKAPIYHSLRWGEAELVIERSFGQRNPKPISYTPADCYSLTILTMSIPAILAPSKVIPFNSA